MLFNAFEDAQECANCAAADGSDRQLLHLQDGANHTGRS
jgi:hypothetical protein